MIIKKFQAPTENEAMLQVKEEMGSDAVIMNIKKIRHRGIMSLLKPTVVEVTAEPTTVLIGVVPPFSRMLLLSLQEARSNAAKLIVASLKFIAFMMFHF